MDGQVLITQFAEQTNKLLLQIRFALVRFRAFRLRLVFCYNRAFAALSNYIEIAHGLPPFGSICRCKCQQLVPVIFILFLPGFDFRRQTDVQVSADGIKVVENFNKTVLHIERW